MGIPYSFVPSVFPIDQKRPFGHPHLVDFPRQNLYILPDFLCLLRKSTHLIATDFDPPKRLLRKAGVSFTQDSLKQTSFRLKPVTEKSAMFKEGVIDGVVVRELKKHADKRGWLMELFREDEIDAEFMPVMGYISVTNAGIARGPHEHADQADYFCFLGPSNFKVFLWDNRENSPTFMNRQVLVAGEDSPSVVIVPAGVVHAYRNIGEKDGMVINCANRLYAGPDRKEPVDEIRHEADPASIFKLD